MFLDKAQKEQLVIRAEDWKEFIGFKKKIDAILEKRKEENPEPEEKAYKCADCGAEAFMKSGTSAKC